MQNKRRSIYDKKFLICSFYLFLILAFLCTTIYLATEGVVTENKEVQSAYEAFIKLQTALNKHELDNLKISFLELEKITSQFDDDAIEWEKIVNEIIGKQVFFNVYNNSKMILSTYDAHTAFLEDSNKETATALIKIIEEYDDMYADRTLLKEFIFDIDHFYEIALVYTSAPNVVTIYEQFSFVQESLNNGKINELKNAVNSMEENIEIFNDFSDKELEQLAVLLYVADGQAAYDNVLSYWIDANVFINVYDVYSAYAQNPNKKTAKAFVEMIDGYDEVYADRTLLESLFPDINNDYTEASKLLKQVNDTNKNDVNENKEIKEKDKTPKMGINDNYVTVATLLTILSLGLIISIKKMR